MKEVWKECPSCPGIEASSCGKARRSDTKKVFAGSFTQAYGRIGTAINGVIYPYYIHTLVADAFIGKRPTGLQINHIDGNKHNNVASNLEYCTRKENAIHAHNLNLYKNSPLNDSIVRVIKDMLVLRFNQELIGEIFGCRRETINSIKNKRTWAHVD